MDFLKILSNQYKINLNDQQQEAVKHMDGPALVLAGPGSGKTTVITARTACLILEAGVSPESILTLTFNKAAQLEMERRFNRIYGADVGQKVHFATLHSFCNRVVRDYEDKQRKRLKRIEGNEETEDTGANKRIILRNIYQRVNESKANDDDLETLINEIGLVKNRMLKDFEGESFNTRNFETIYREYEDYKRAHLYIDFDDMLTYAYSILNRCPDILRYYREKYGYIQVDEGQDLSKVQFEVLNLLVKREQSNLFIVADDDQSIYGFRGAEPQYILNIREQFKECNVYRLENNYRSTANIVEMSSNFIKKNERRFDKKHRTDNGYKGEPNIVAVEDDAEQLAFIAEQLEQHSHEGRSTAVLYRNNLSSVAVVDLLDRRGIPFKVKQSKLFFFSHWLVQDILAFLNFALDQTDSQSFSRIYYKMNRYISKAMLETAMKTSYKESIIDGILAGSDMKPYQQKSIEGLKLEFKRLAVKSPLAALTYIEDSFRYFDSVSDYCETVGLSLDYLYGMFGIMKTVAAGCPTIPLYLQRIEELQEMLERPGILEYPEYMEHMKDKRAVTLTTLHSSKGLEYDAVLMMDLIDTETPGKRAVDAEKKNKDNSLMEEERRLFYVGMTRAKEYLYLIYPAEKNGVVSNRSSFINEVMGIMKKRAVDEIGEGVIIHHKRFGRGVVAAVFEQKGGRTLMEIDFNGTRKKLDLAVCIENGLINILR